MEKHRQISSGGVVFRNKDGLVDIALISVRGGKVWGLPKGRAESGENLARTAHREVAEETGLQGRIIDKIGHVEYFFTHKDEGHTEWIFKIVYFFLMEYVSGDVGDHDDEVTDCRWFPIDEARGLLRFEDEREIVGKAKAMIEEIESGEQINPVSR